MKAFFMFICGTVACICLALAVLLGSERGLHLILHGVNTWSPVKISVTHIEGSVLKGWQMQEVHIQVPERVKIHLETFRFHWQAQRLLSKELHIQEISGQGLVVQVLRSQERGPREEAAVLRDIRLPLAVQLDKVQVQGLEVHRLGQSQAFVMQEVAASASAQGGRLDLHQLYGDSPFFMIDVQGRLEAQGLWPVQLQGRWRVPDPGINTLEGQLEAQGNLGEALALNIQMQQPVEVLVQGQVRDILNDPQWQAQAKTQHFHLQDIKVAAPVQGTLRILEATGNRTAYRAVLAAEVQYQDYPALEVKAKVQAKDYGGLHIEAFSVQQGESLLLAQADLDWIEGFSWQGALQATALNPALFAEEWAGRINGQLRSQGRVSPQGLRVAVEVEELAGQLKDQDVALKGRILLDGGQVTVQDVELQSPLAQVQMTGQTDSLGRLDLGLKVAIPDLSQLVPEVGGAVQAEARASGPWQHLALDLALDGTAIHWQEQHLARLHSRLQADLIPTGKDSGIHIHDLHLRLNEQAALQVQGFVAWTEGLRWQAQVSATDFDPSLLHPDFPGQITALLHSAGSLHEEGDIQAAVDLAALHGELRGFPLFGTGAVHIKDSVVDIQALDLRSGTTQVQAQGRVDWQDALALNFKAESTDLGQLLPQAQGALHVEGQVKGTILQPQLQFHAQARDLSFQDLALKHLTADMQADLRTTGNVDIQLKAKDMQMGEEHIQDISVQVQGQMEDHQVDLAVAADRGQGRLKAQGALWQQQWQGQFLTLSVEHPQWGAWQMAKAADVLLSANQVRLAGFSLSRDAVQASLNASWQEEAGWQVQGDLEGLSLKHLREDWQLPLLPQLEGLIGANFQASGKAALPQQAEFNLLVPDLALTAENYEDDDGSLTTWHWTNNRLALVLQENTVQVQAHTKFQDSSSASLKALIRECGDFTKPEKMPLEGTLEVRIKDLGPLTVLSDYRVQAAGEFGGKVRFGGTVAAPRMDGSLSLSDATKAGQQLAKKLHIPDLGINITDLDLSLAGTTQSNAVNLRLASGAGQILAKGEVRRGGTASFLDFNIQGENFQALDLPEYKAVVSPDLHLLFSPKGILLNGLLTVNRAHLAPTGFSGAVSPSSDVVVIDQAGQEEKRSSPLALDLTLILGQEVAVDAFGLKGWLDGRLRISAQPGQIPTGTGSLSLRDSAFDFEGTSLKLSEGRIFYQGGPLDNPGLDIRATREVNKMSLGIHLTGNVNNMDIKLFSDVPMEDSEILSRLLTGQNMISSGRGGEGAFSPAAAALGKLGGDALLRSINPLATLNMEDAVDLSIGGGEDASDLSLVMGKEIYKDLYISYGKALTGEGGSFKARYDLKYGFSVETESTSKTTGADLFWSLER